mgnify:CR=1 FL=1
MLTTLTPTQLALDLPFEDGDRLEDFLRSPANAEALDDVLAWPSWPAPALLLWGPTGCGRTHLARIWARTTGGRLLDGKRLGAAPAALEMLGDARSCVIDDADAVHDDRILLHLYNMIAGQSGHLLLTASGPLGAWGLQLPDLTSRLRTAWSCRIDQPDDPLLAALLVKQLQDRQLTVLPGVVAYLATHMERSFAAARRIVRELDRASLCARRPITLPLARAVLASDLAAGEADQPDAG